MALTLEEANRIIRGALAKAQELNIKISAARLLADGKTVEIDLEGHKPSMSLKVAWDLESTNKEELKGDVHCTVRAMGK